MASQCFTGSQSTLAAGFTFRGKRRLTRKSPAPARRTLSIVLSFLLVAPADARSELGSTSSASVRISLSVAPKYALGITRPPIEAPTPVGSRTWCLATNGQAMTLPVLIIRSGPGQPSQDDGYPLGSCSSDTTSVRASTLEGGGGIEPRLFIVRPE